MRPQVRWLSSKAPAALVKQLRLETQAPLLDCKRALEASGLDLALARDELRRTGKLKAAARAGRKTTAGLVGVALNAGRSRGALVELACETDFVARNDLFVGLLERCCGSALALGPQEEQSQESLAEKLVEVDGGALQDAVADCVAKVGENVSVRSAAAVDMGLNGVLGTYLHNKKSDVVGSQACIVGLEVMPAMPDDEKARSRIVKLADSLALQAVGTQAMFLIGIPETTLAHERELEETRLIAEATEKATADGKDLDPEVARKRASKKVEKILKQMSDDQVLMKQMSMIPGQEGKKISSIVDETGSALGVKLSLTKLVIYKGGADKQIEILEPEFQS